MRFHIDLTFNVKPLVNYEQVIIYMNQLNAIPEIVNQHITNLRDGLEKDVWQSRVIFNGNEFSYKNHIVDDYKENFYYSPFKNLSKSLTVTQKDSVLTVVKTIIQTVLITQFKCIKTFFETEYLPKTRMSIGVLNLPRRNDFHLNRINFYIARTIYTAEVIHQIGLTKVAHIKAGMQTIIEQFNLKDSLAHFIQFLGTDTQFYAKIPKELLMSARHMAKRLDVKLPKFFTTLPRKPYGVAPVPYAIAYNYKGRRNIGTSKNSTEPGYYWINTYDLASRPLNTLAVLTAHEALTGHNLQGSLNNKLGYSNPQFRTALFLSINGEVWGLCTEYIADEMNLYKTSY